MANKREQRYNAVDAVQAVHKLLCRGYSDVVQRRFVQVLGDDVPMRPGN